MNVSENNLKFEYLYRDGGNYKQFGSVILSNPPTLTPDSATDTLRKHLIDGEFFDPRKVKVPCLEVYDFDPEIDHDWYEFHKFILTNENPTESINAEMFLERFA